MVDKVLEYVWFTANKNSLPGDVSAINPGGVRLGTPALTTRGLNEADFERVAEFLHRGCELALQAQKIAELKVEAEFASGESSRKSKKVLLKDFQKELDHNEDVKRGIAELRSEVEDFSSTFYMPG
jgi:glycine hydroxymethyltransferase